MQLMGGDLKIAGLDLLENAIQQLTESGFRAFSVCVKDFQLIKREEGDHDVTDAHVIPECYRGDKISFDFFVRKSKLLEPRPCGIQASTVAVGRKDSLKGFGQIKQYFG